MDRTQASNILIDIGDNQQQQQLQQQQQQQLPNNLDDLRERDGNVRRIESDVIEVNQIFKELATMVRDQGETIDTIESSIFRANSQVQQGAQEISKAREYQEKARRRKCLLFGILFVVLLIVMLVAFTK